MQLRVQSAFLTGQQSRALWLKDWKEALASLASLAHCEELVQSTALRLRRFTENVVE